jgi:hypothetical protein
MRLDIIVAIMLTEWLVIVAAMTVMLMIDDN